MKTRTRTVFKWFVGHALIAALGISVPRVGMAQTPAYATIHLFTGDVGGAQPLAGVILGRNGALYGTTAVRLELEQNQLVAGIEWFLLGV